MIVDRQQTHAAAPRRRASVAGHRAGSKRWARWLFAPTAALLLFLLAAPAAWAHASLISTDPADGQVLSASPETITVTFSERVSLADTGNALLDATGSPASAQITARDNTVLITPDEELSDGSYIVTWRVISLDSHPVAGGITFAVGQPSTVSASLPAGAEDSPVNLARQIAVALRYAGLLGFAGVLWFALLVAPEAHRRAPRFARSLRNAGGWLAAVAVGSALAAPPLATAWQNGEGFAALGTGRLWQESLSDPAAVSALVILLGVLGATVAARRKRTIPAVAAAALALGALTIEGHTRSFGPAWAVLPADLAHLAVAAVWFGGLIGMTVLLRRGHSVPITAAVLAVRRFSTAALASVLLLVVAAGVLWWQIAGSISALWSSYYGELVLTKAILVAAVLAVAAWNRYRLVPAAHTRGDSELDEDSPQIVESSAQLSRLRRTVAVEAFVLIAVIGVTGVLASQQPPERSTQVAAEQTVSVTGDGITAEIVIRPGTVGTNSLEFEVTDPNGALLDAVDDPTLAVRMIDADLGPFQHPVTKTGPGRYQAMVDFPLPGTWSVALTVRASEFSAPVLVTEVTVK